MKSLYFSIAFILLNVTLFAYSSITVGSADTLHPVNQTEIVMQSENLYIRYDQSANRWFVSVDYLFYNPGDERMEQLLFVSKSFTMGINKYKGLSNYKIIVNNEDVDFKIEKVMLVESDDQYQENFTSNILFPYGETRIIHQYDLFGTATGMPNLCAIPYNLLTGNNWAGLIGKIRIKIDFDGTTVLSRYNPLLTVSGTSREAFFRKQEKVTTIRGALVFEAENYSPTENLFVEFYGHGYMRMQPLNDNSQLLVSMGYMNNIEDLRKLTIDELSLLRNGIYAWHGYVFKNPLQRETFNAFCWYLPDENAVIELNQYEKNALELIKRVEAERGE